jgi:hypothetical protein
VDTDTPDDVDRLFARLERAPVPPDLTARVLARTVGVQPTVARSRVAWPWLAAGLVALVALAVAGYLLGATLAATDGLDVLEAIAGDLSLIAVAPGDVLAAVWEVVPWPFVIVAGGGAAFLSWAAARAVAGPRPTSVRRHAVG